MNRAPRFVPKKDLRVSLEGNSSLNTIGLGLDSKKLLNEEDNKKEMNKKLN